MLIRKKKVVCTWDNSFPREFFALSDMQTANFFADRPISTDTLRSWTEFSRCHWRHFTKIKRRQRPLLRRKTQINLRTAPAIEKIRYGDGFRRGENSPPRRICTSRIPASLRPPKMAVVRGIPADRTPPPRVPVFSRRGRRTPGTSRDDH
jgi:hypothetical protein